MALMQAFIYAYQIRLLQAAHGFSACGRRKAGRPGGRSGKQAIVCAATKTFCRGCRTMSGKWRARRSEVAPDRGLAERDAFQLKDHPGLFI
ncbi:hypothetical protein ACFFJ7_16070 [Pseudochelatococcus lubricantis]|uniref:hypothetical protein n=1 Tax=Pseudochelatococcus lubricantis TaxID=1538102 RepID=UPI0035ECA6FC